MKANKLGDIVYTEKNSPAEKMRYCDILLGKNLTDSIVQEGKNSFSYLKGRSRISFCYLHFNSKQIQSSIVAY